MTLAIAAGAGLDALLPAFPLPILAGLLASAGILHIGLLRDLRGTSSWMLALANGAIGFSLNLLWALAFGLAAWWLPRGLARLRARAAEAPA